MLAISAPILFVKEKASERTLEISQDIYENTENGALAIGIQEANYFNEYFGELRYISALRPVGYSYSKELVEEKIAEYKEKGKKSYVIYFNTPYYSYKSGIDETNKELDRIKGNSRLVYRQTYPLRTPFYANEMSLEIHEVE